MIVTNPDNNYRTITIIDIIFFAIVHFQISISLINLHGLSVSLIIFLCPVLEEILTVKPPFIFTGITFGTPLVKFDFLVIVDIDRLYLAESYVFERYLLAGIILTRLCFTFIIIILSELYGCFSLLVLLKTCYIEVPGVPCAPSSPPVIKTNF